ncbi:peroxide stress protein YaaA [Pararobbsia alpina]|uniref:peroxide stress protein YaaA n=1 Tax=Pararobbsia alpina TaxID=621374 RepID=UPI0039A69C80
MIIVLSPAKSLDYDSEPHTQRHSLPQFVDHSAELVETLRGLSPASIGSLMSISDPLANLNFQRYQDWTPHFSPANAKQAVLAFNGDVYEGLDARSLAEADLDFAQQHVRILSGLYGVLRPLDLMQPYRLEMGTRLGNARGRDLYAFWGDRITHALNGELGDRDGLSRAVVNLASEEYFKSVRPKKLEAPVITPVFEDFKGGRYKIISFYAKRARGMMARYAVLNRIRHPNALKDFDTDGYAFAPNVSSEQTWVFRRRLAQ